MGLKKIGVTVGFVAGVIGTGVYFNEVAENPEHRGDVGNIAIKAIDVAIPQTRFNQFETAKARVVQNSFNGTNKFNQYLDGLLGEKATSLHNPQVKEDLYKIAQELKKLSVDDMSKSGFDEEELKGFFLYMLSIAERKYVVDQTERDSLKSLANKTINVLEEQHASAVATFGAMGDFMQKYTQKNIWGRSDILLGLAFPKTDFQKDSFNQRVAKQYLMQNFNFKESDLSPSKVIQAASSLNSLEALKRQDSVAYLEVSTNLNCISAFIVSAANGIKLADDPAAIGSYYTGKVSKVLGEGTQDAIKKRAKELDAILMSEGGDHIVQIARVCNIKYENNR